MPIAMIRTMKPTPTIAVRLRRSRLTTSLRYVGGGRASTRLVGSGAASVTGAGRLVEVANACPYVRRTRGSSTEYSTSTTKFVTQMIEAYVSVTAISTG